MVHHGCPKYTLEQMQNQGLKTRFYLLETILLSEKKDELAAGRVKTLLQVYNYYAVCAG